MSNLNQEIERANKLLSQNQFALAFPSALNRDYLLSVPQERRGKLKFSLWVGLAVMAMCLFLDASVGQDQLYRGLAVRTGVTLPLHLAGLLALQRAATLGAQAAAVIIPMTSGLAVTTWLATVATESGELYMLSVGMMIVAINLVVPLRPKEALVLTGAGSGAVAAIELMLSYEPNLFLLIFVLAISFLSFFVSIWSEGERRRLYLLHLLERLRSRQLANANAQLRVLSHRDTLTGLANRRLWDKEFEIAAREAATKGSVLGVLIVDIDRFKSINDHFGHAAGDACLARVGRILEDYLLESAGLVARIGGDELAAFFTDRSEEEIERRASQTRSAISKARLGPGGATITVSIGVAAEIVSEPQMRKELFERADRGLYEAKQAGRDTVSIGRIELQSEVGEPIEDPEVNKG
ncbi:hypothetical protein B5C34_13570 [Pacificimonas flava]|uniref:diguanylate cyclase n=2 Tax=Pacificimonas TaxID=1960290 RepID=A0A219B7N7_9SPHN|nr:MULTISPECIES: GGDEF domain-containing protein [Pacificimonas]MBZ6379852.1 GGDEF domain-containing protein [Pacificimonas aurantium]OWV34385.1 hypothetical protein B5C34_13570 [Pacificimonas flava]